MNDAHIPRPNVGRVAYWPRRRAADYLTEKLGRPISVGSLHRHASEGTGPPYVLILGRASYTRDGLDAWVEALAKEPPPRAGKRQRTA